MHFNREISLRVTDYLLVVCGATGGGKSNLSARLAGSSKVFAPAVPDHVSGAVLCFEPIGSRYISGSLSGQYAQQPRFEN